MRIKSIAQTFLRLNILALVLVMTGCSPDTLAFGQDGPVTPALTKTKPICAMQRKNMGPGKMWVPVFIRDEDRYVRP